MFAEIGMDTVLNLAALLFAFGGAIFAFVQQTNKLNTTFSVQMARLEEKLDGVIREFTDHKNRVDQRHLDHESRIRQVELDVRKP